MKKTPNYIKKTLDEIRLELLKDKKLQLSRQLYVEKLKEIFSEQVIDLKDGLETRMSSTGTDKTYTVSTSSHDSAKPMPEQKNKNKQKIIFLNNEILKQNLNEIEEANNELQNFANSDENIIELKDEISENEDQKIIELIEEVDEIINLTDEVAVKVTDTKDNFVQQDEITDSPSVREDVARGTDIF